MLKSSRDLVRIAERSIANALAELTSAHEILNAANFKEQQLFEEGKKQDFDTAEIEGEKFLFMLNQLQRARSELRKMRGDNQPAITFNTLNERNMIGILDQVI